MLRYLNQLLILICSFFCTCVIAQQVPNYPQKPIKIIVSFTAGGTTDILAREVGNQLSIRWKVPVIVENHAGAAGNLGTEIVGGAAPDGHTLLVSSNGPISINPSLFSNLAVNPQKALQPVAMLGDVPNILVVPSSLGVKNWKDFLAYIKAHKDHINYKGAEATRDLVGGQLQFMFATAPSVVSLIKGGQLTAIAVSSKKRMSALPDLPTLTEMGIDIATGAWFGLFAPLKTPPSILNKLNETVTSVLDEPAVKKRLLALGSDPTEMNVDEFTKFIRNDFALWAPIVKASGAKPE